MADRAGEHLVLLFEHSPVPQFVSDVRGAIVMANPAYAALVGSTVEDVVGTTPVDVTHPDDLPILFAHGARLIDRELDVFEIEARILRLDGEVRWCAVTCTLAVGNDGDPFFVSHLQDITERKEAETQLAVSQARFRLLADSLPVGIHQRDRTGRLVYVNRKWSEITGISAEDAIGQDHLEIVHPDDRERLFEASRQLLRQGGDYHHEFRIVRPDGTERSVSSRAVWLPDDDGRPISYVGSLEDVTGAREAMEEQKRLERKLAHQATHDALTGLPNRALFLSELHRVVGGSSTAEPAAVLFIDLDRFKSVNDELGHEIGDELLREVAARLAEVLRPTDVVARLGGDEFVVLCPAVGSVDVAVELAQRLLRAVSEEPVVVQEHKIEATASIGVSVSGPDTHQHPERLVREADAAMYRAKASGRDRHEVFDTTLRDVDTGERPADPGQSTTVSPPDQVANSSA